jgi:3-hydroxyacyl-CoA dehydrogenase
MKSIERVAVLGAGTMGSRIAAHFANAGLRVLLLDLPMAAADTKVADRNAIARKGLESARTQKPVAFYKNGLESQVDIGNFEDDLDRIKTCQWVIEAVTENLAIKRALWQKVAERRHPDAILSTNTSGIPLAQIGQGFDAQFQRQFLGTHFFNPPRYLHLMELIPGPGTDGALLTQIQRFAERRLGKGVVMCKDTPNFVANRIGSFFGSAVYRATVEQGLTVEEVDALTGPLLGIPKSASFRLLDIVGLDVWAFVSKNLYEAVPNDPWREWFLPPQFMTEMVERGWIGEKKGQGFYKRVGPAKEIHAIDWRTLEYHPSKKAAFESVEATKPIADFAQRLQALVFGQDRVARFLWSVLKPVFAYSATMVGEIADRIVEIDRAMRWGYGHRMGPFELWDALGFRAVSTRMIEEGERVPPVIHEMLAENVRSLYRAADHLTFPRTEYFDFGHLTYAPMEERAAVVQLANLKRARGRVDGNAGASLIDLGDGVLCCEFHSKMNSIGQDALEMLDRGVELLETGFDAMVIANQGENFSVGANLVLLLMAAQDEDWDGINRMINAFQQSMLRIKYAPKPVVAAAFSRALGGGCEIVMQSHRAQAQAELYIGLVEVGVGLIPAAGGCKEMVIRNAHPMKSFETVGQAKVSGSAAEARELGFLSDDDRISMNPEFLIKDAAQFALQLAGDYQRGAPKTDIKVGGEPAYGHMRLAAWHMKESGFLSEHDFAIGEKLAYILSGGRVTAGSVVTEQYLLDLEREAFLSLCGMTKTQERIQYMLKSGKPLRN